MLKKITQNKLVKRKKKKRHRIRRRNTTLDIQETNETKIWYEEIVQKKGGK